MALFKPPRRPRPSRAKYKYSGVEKFEIIAPRAVHEIVADVCRRHGFTSDELFGFRKPGSPTARPKDGNNEVQNKWNWQIPRKGWSRLRTPDAVLARAEIYARVYALGPPYSTLRIGKIFEVNHTQVLYAYILLERYRGKHRVELPHLVYEPHRPTGPYVGEWARRKERRIKRNVERKAAREALNESQPGPSQAA